jgi:DNA mismatch repair protein MutL
MVQQNIQILPDHLANQIAAGEVVQRPASAVKELLENAIDAGATQIQLIIKDAGKELIQVIDNGKGMSPIDARMSFERHATSKIKHIDDLFAITTMGFRGEALASIAAVAQVELKTKPKDEELGTHIVIDASEVLIQEPIATTDGTNFAIKNLFYNVPARRKFLKSNTSEMKHIIDEFTRVAMAHPNISFKFVHNNTEQFHLSLGTLKTRIIELLGHRLEKSLVPVTEDTELIQINGFIGKPDSATKTRGNQFFFINNRFIKSPYLHHAVTTAFDGLLDKDTFPFYALFLTLDPQRVDVNVHPTKQEVKFDDDRMLYAYLQAAIKHALGKFNIAPSIDFSLNAEIQNMDAVRLPQSETIKSATQDNYLFQSFTKAGQAHFIDKSNQRQEWEKQQDYLFKPLTSLPIEQNLVDISFPNINTQTTFTQPNHNLLFQETEGNNNKTVIVWRQYLISTIKSGILLIHSRRALERIAYEQLAAAMVQHQTIAQQLLFPTSMHLSASDSIILTELLSELQTLGFDITVLGGHSYGINAVPATLDSGNEVQLIEAILEHYKHAVTAYKHNPQEQVIRTMAKRSAAAHIIQASTAAEIIDELFACTQPEYTPDGEKIFNTLPQTTLDQYL